MSKEAVFIVQEDGRSWKYENILVLQEGASGWVVFIKGDEQDTITCSVPNQLALLDFLSSITCGSRPLFSSIAEFSPLC